MLQFNSIELQAKHELQYSKCQWKKEHYVTFNTCSSKETQLSISNF